MMHAVQEAIPPEMHPRSIDPLQRHGIGSHEERNANITRSRRAG